MAFTFFFRDRETLDAVAEHALPVLKARRYIRIWDAGCAMGPEPYTLAIILRENMGRFLFRNVRIHATDIDESDFGTVIARGVYPEVQLKRMPAAILERYFAPSEPPGHYQICEELRQAVSFQRHDLLSLQPIRDQIGLVVCKNVLLHFGAQERVDVLRMFHQGLDAEGFLVLEQTQKLPPEVAPLFRQVAPAAQLFQKA